MPLEQNPYAANPSHTLSEAIPGLALGIFGDPAKAGEAAAHAAVAKLDEAKTVGENLTNTSRQGLAASLALANGPDGRISKDAYLANQAKIMADEINAHGGNAAGLGEMSNVLLAPVDPRLAMISGGHAVNQDFAPTQAEGDRVAARNYHPSETQVMAQALLAAAGPQGQQPPVARGVDTQMIPGDVNAGSPGMSLPIKGRTALDPAGDLQIADAGTDNSALPVDPYSSPVAPSGGIQPHDPFKDMIAGLAGPPPQGAPTIGANGMGDMLNTPAPEAAQVKADSQPQGWGNRILALKQKDKGTEYKDVGGQIYKFEPGKEPVAFNDAGGQPGVIDGIKDVQTSYQNLMKTIPKTPNGSLGAAIAAMSNKVGMPTDTAIAQGRADAQINNLFMATIRSLKGTGRVQQSEIQQILAAQPKADDSLPVKMAKLKAHLEYYNQRMVELGHPEGVVPIDGEQSSPGADDHLAKAKAAIANGAPAADVQKLYEQNTGKKWPG